MLLLSSALAMAINWRWPWEKLVPPADTCVSKVIGALVSVSVPVGEATEEAIVPSRSTPWIDAGCESRRDVGRDGSREVRCEAN